MKKIYIALILCFCMIPINGYTTTEEVRVLLNDQRIVFDVQPFISDEQVWIPLRGVIEALGGYVEWNVQEEQVELVYENKDIILKPGEEKIILNGQEILVHFLSVMKQDRVFAPLNLFDEILGMDIYWNEELETVYINSSQVNIPLNHKYLVQNIYDESGAKLLVRDCNNLVVFPENNQVAERLNSNLYSNYIYGLDEMSNDYYGEYREELMKESREEYEQIPASYVTKFQRSMFDINFAKGDLLALTLEVDNGNGIVNYAPKVFDVQTGEQLVLSELLDMSIEDIEDMLLSELNKNGNYSIAEKEDFLKQYSFTIENQMLKIYYPEKLAPADEELLSDQVNKQTFITIPCDQLKWKINLETGLWTEKFYEIADGNVVYKDIPILITENLKNRVMNFLLLDENICDSSDFEFDVKYTSNKDYFDNTEFVSQSYLTQIKAYAEIPVEKQSFIDMITAGLTRETAFPSEKLKGLDFEKNKAECFYKTTVYSGGNFSTSYGITYIVQEISGNKIRVYVSADIPDTVFK